MGIGDHTAVLKQRFDELASGLSELENLRSRVIAAEQMQKMRSADRKPAAPTHRTAKPKSSSAKSDRPKRRLARPPGVGQ
ncbi:hypothetical protein GGD65_000509 [Bradyrhizobium sp. CIR18]|uniref:hypothetical protein n=1 Tax=Bradyrhizobium sp. CIR18 TaxID=2663839 RepID=UPI001605A9BF|nr:hypothetical protein [Bradyrhizobium sp. CIR18]MBB4359511.1 hypothetical protein [Bradyrhizobium sp. CIR18]